jgi:hypothetical protein
MVTKSSGALNEKRSKWFLNTFTDLLSTVYNGFPGRIVLLLLLLILSIAADGIPRVH